MVAMVEMVRKAAEAGGRDRFSCPVPVWELLRELGETFGWRPKGTTYVLSPNSKIETPARRNYQPGEARDHKSVAAEDAAAWAAALVKAKKSPHFAAMIQSRSDASKEAIELLPGALDEFIEFAYGGSFAFAVSTSID
jgi:hypothetical protein